VLQLDAATVLLQWAVGGLLFLWVTTRRREVGIGYGWLLRGTYLLMAVAAVVVGVWLDPVPVREASSVAVALATAYAFGVSIVRRKAGVQGERERQARRAARVQAMTGRTGTDDTDGHDRADLDSGRADGDAVANPSGYEQTGIERRRTGPDTSLPEFPPRLDLIAPLVGIPGLLAAGIAAGDPALLSIARILAGTAFLGAVSDAMLLGHWYLVQPGLSRAPLLDLVRWTARTWPVEVAVMLWPVGMVSVLNGSIDDGWDGLLGWFWVACAVTTIVLVGVTRAALRERYYSAVMAATGLLYRRVTAEQVN
jgi:hypothetical protein